MSKPKHGEERNKRIHSEWSGMFGYKATVSEKYCATCNIWIEVHGVTGALEFMAKHEHDNKY